MESRQNRIKSRRQPRIYWFCSGELDLLIRIRGTGFTDSDQKNWICRTCRQGPDVRIESLQKLPDVNQVVPLTQREIEYISTEQSLASSARNN